jgi:hypothetical protein
MSSPTETVNGVMKWLEGLFGIVLPTLPLAGAWAKLTALWNLPILGSLPKPQDPMPWLIDVEPSWTAPISGVTISPQKLQIRVEQTGSPAPILAKKGDHP